MNLEGYREILAAMDLPEPEKVIRKERLEQFLQQGFPTTKHEEWKYTSVQAAVSVNRQVALPPDEIAADSWEQDILPLPEAARIVMVNGQFRPELSQNLNLEGLRISSASSRDFLFETATESSFVALNAAFAKEAVKIEVQPGKAIEKPLLVVHLSIGEKETMLNGRILVDVGPGAHLEMVEQWIHLGGDVLDNEVLEMQIGANANVQHFMLQASKSTQVISFTEVNQGQGSNYKSMVLTTEGKLIRNNLHVHHAGEHCETHLNGLYLLGGGHVDNHSLVDHAFPNCYSNELYKGVLAKKSTAVFNGKVLVRKDAQKTNAFQSNRTVLLDPGARMNTKPQLEIFADDVKCSHGATTGRLDEEALFYLQSRGLTRHDAMSLLTLAFASEVLEKVKAGTLREYFKAIVEEKLSSIAKPE